MLKFKANSPQDSCQAWTLHSDGQSSCTWLISVKHLLSAWNGPNGDGSCRLQSWMDQHFQGWPSSWAGPQSPRRWSSSWLVCGFCCAIPTTGSFLPQPSRPPMMVMNGAHLHGCPRPDCGTQATATEVVTCSPAAHIVEGRSMVRMQEASKRNLGQYGRCMEQCTLNGALKDLWCRRSSTAQGHLQNQPCQTPPDTSLHHRCVMAPKVYGPSLGLRDMAGTKNIL